MRIPSSKVRLRNILESQVVDLLFHLISLSEWVLTRNPQLETLPTGRRVATALCFALSAGMASPRHSSDGLWQRSILESGNCNFCTTVKFGVSSSGCRTESLCPLWWQRYSNRMVWRGNNIVLNRLLRKDTWFRIDALIFCVIKRIFHGPWTSDDGQIDAGFEMNTSLTSKYICGDGNFLIKFEILDNRTMVSPPSELLHKSQHVCTQAIQHS